MREHNSNTVGKTHRIAIHVAGRNEQCLQACDLLYDRFRLLFQLGALQVQNLVRKLGGTLENLRPTCLLER